MKKIKTSAPDETFQRKFYFEYDAKDKEKNSGTEHFMDVLRYWWGKEADEET